MLDKESFNNDGELSDLAPAVAAVRGDVPDDPQWIAARQRLRSALSDALGETAPSSRPAGKRPFWRAAGKPRWLAAVAVLAAVLLLLLLNRRPPGGLPEQQSPGRAWVEQTCAAYVRGADESGERSLRSGDAIRAGERLRVAPQGSLAVRMDDGSRLWLSGATQAEYVGPRSNNSPAWRLPCGEIQADVRAARPNS